MTWAQAEREGYIDSQEEREKYKEQGAVMALCHDDGLLYQHSR